MNLNTKHIKESKSKQDFDSVMNAFIAEEVRQFIETEFYEKVAEQAKLENFQHDTAFLKNPLKHIALFTDHGVVHVRDVAMQVLTVIERVNGKLIPLRNDNDLAFLKAYSVQLAYLHDIGMSDFSQAGRFMHPEFAAQFVFTEAFTAWLEVLWTKNAGNLPWVLMSHFKDQYSEDKIKVIYRELLALSVAHSKSKVPIDVVNNPTLLRARMIHILDRPLPLLLLEQKMGRRKSKLSSANTPKKQTALEREVRGFQKKIDTFTASNPQTNPDLKKHYTAFESEGYQWLMQASQEGRRLIINVLDCLRCLRAADALRQRGTTLRTSAGYEIYVDSLTANAIYALRSSSSDRLYLLEGKKTINAGEANLASSELDASGHLRVSFQLGAFHDKKITNKAAQNLATVIDDIQADSVQSFLRNAELDTDIFEPPSVRYEDIRILLESTNDNPKFASQVSKALKKTNPGIASRVKVSFSLHGYDLDEVTRYLEGAPLSDYLDAYALRDACQTHLQQLNYKFESYNPLPGEEDIRVISLSSGEQLIKGGTNSGFVYFPLSDGLHVYPLGGYESQAAPAWIPLGNTGVIRGSIRNAHVMANKPVTLICVPKEVYLQHWYRPLTPRELVQAWSEE